MLSAIAVDGYRSLRSLVLELARVTVVTGANGSGKSSLYRALRLLAAASRDGAIAALAREGGLPSTLWAGPENIGLAVRDGKSPVQGTVRRGPVSLRLGFSGDDLGYAIDLGLPVPAEAGPTAFGLDPEIKVESVWSGAILRPATLLSERRGPIVRIRGDDGWRLYENRLPSWSSMLGEVSDPQVAPELYALREEVRSWRFYDHLRTDVDAPARRSQIGTRTPVLASDGSDLAAALQTICEIGDPSALDAAIDHAFPGSRIHIDVVAGLFSLRLSQPGLLRPLDASELSDGTLRYLLWIAALLSPRPAELLVLNEPETSLHPSLLAPLARLVARASAHSQLIVVSHSESFVTALRAEGALVHELEKSFGETRVVGLGSLDGPAWQWPKR
jgi:predicted ATPase